MKRPGSQSVAVAFGAAMLCWAGWPAMPLLAEGPTGTAILRAGRAGVLGPPSPFLHGAALDARLSGAGRPRVSREVLAQAPANQPFELTARVPYLDKDRYITLLSADLIQSMIRLDWRQGTRPTSVRFTFEKRKYPRNIDCVFDASSPVQGVPDLSYWIESDGKVVSNGTFQISGDFHFTTRAPADATSLRFGLADTASKHDRWFFLHGCRFERASS